MTRRTASMAFAGVVLAVLVAVAVAVPMPYVVLAPGVTENTLGRYDGKPVVTISGHRTYATTGHLDLTTVSVTSPDYSPRLPDILKAWWSTREIVLPRDVVYPPDQSISEVKQENTNQMLGSQQSAIVAGLAAAGFDALDVTVGDVVPDAPADGVLRKGDVVTAVDGKTVNTTQDVIDAISQRTPGDSVELDIERGGTPDHLTLATEPASDDPGAARVGVSLGDAFDPPFSVKFDLGQEIGGPSAGLMFSLAIYDLLTPGELTGGRFVAGTGTIDLKGTVGVIGGIQQKIAGAYDSGARVFLVPSGDCAEATGSDLADEVQLVRVSTMEQAVAALQALNAGNALAVPTCQSVTGG